MTPTKASAPVSDPVADLDAQLVGVRTGLTRLGRLLSSRRVHVGMAGAAGVELAEQPMNVLRALAERESISIGELARVAHMDTGAVSRQVRVLEDGGLAVRSASPQHRSIVLVECTDEGRVVAQRFERVRKAQLNRALESWSDEERETLGRLLVRLVDDLQGPPYLRSDR